MKTADILIFGRHTGIMQNVMSFLKQHGFTRTKAVFTNENAMHELTTGRYDVLIIGGGVDHETRKAIREYIAGKKIRTRIVEHFGNPSSLPDEIREAIS
ncbi:MAG: hypothetical protein IPJ02_00660 [Chitinophagaceae bacterium]|nr:hypothetical protein [Chitinophagaceae bacterium]